MVKRMVNVLFGLALLIAPALAQDTEIRPAWEHLTKNGVPGFPFMVAEVGTNDFSLGDSDFDMISSLVRYDENRLLLYVVENGIDETDPNHDAEMAEQFPDRAIWWINANDGSPMGIALHVGLEPWPNSEYYIQKATGQHPDGPDTDRGWSLTDIYPVCSVDGDGYLYVGNVHNIIRYSLDGDQFVNPEKVWNRPEEETPSQHYRAWRIWDMNVIGSGDNKKMTIDSKFWIEQGGTWYLSSSDGGQTWEWEDEFNSGGGASVPIVNDELGEEWVFNTAFPGRDSGKGFTPLRRWLRPVGSDEEFQNDIPELWAPSRDPAIDDGNFEEPGRVTTLYQGWTKCDVAAYPGVPYIAVCTMPRWQSNKEDWGDQPLPTAWLALHSHSADPNGDFIEGDFVSGYQIDTVEADEIGSPGNDGDPWHNTYLTEVNMYVPDSFPEGAFEILWSGGTLGFGRYVVGDVEVDVPDWSIY